MKKIPWGTLSRSYTENVIPIGQVEVGKIVRVPFFLPKKTDRKKTEINGTK